MLYLLLGFIHRIFVIHSEFLANKYPEFVDYTILFLCLFSFYILIPLLLISLILFRICVVPTAYISILFNMLLRNFFLHKALAETSWKAINFQLYNPMSAQVFYLQIASSIHSLGRHTLLMDAELYIFLFNLVIFSNYFYVRDSFLSTELAERLPYLLLSYSVTVWVLQKKLKFRKKREQCSPQYLTLIQWLVLILSNMDNCRGPRREKIQWHKDKLSSEQYCFVGGLSFSCGFKTGQVSNVESDTEKHRWF